MLSITVLSPYTFLEAYRIENYNNQTIHIFVLKDMVDAGAVLLSKGWTSKSLNALSSFVTLTEHFEPKAKLVNWGIKFISNFSIDIMSEVVAQILSLKIHLYVAPHGYAQWSAEKIAACLHKPYQTDLFFMIFPSSSYGSVDYNTLLYMGPLKINGHYIYTEDGKIYDVNIKKSIKFTPFTYKNGTLVPLKQEAQS